MNYLARDPADFYGPDFDPAAPVPANPGINPGPNPPAVPVSPYRAPVPENRPFTVTPYRSRVGTALKMIFSWSGPSAR